MKIAITFAGQGAQYPGMGKDIYDTYPAAKEIFDMDIVELPFARVRRILRIKTEGKKTQSHSLAQQEGSHRALLKTRLAFYAERHDFVKWKTAARPVGVRHGERRVTFA